MIALYRAAIVFLAVGSGIVTDDEKATARKYKRIADVALDKLSKLNIKSSNKFWTLNRDEVGSKLGTARERRNSAEWGLHGIAARSRFQLVTRVSLCPWECRSRSGNLQHRAFL